MDYNTFSKRTFEHISVDKNLIRVYIASPYAKGNTTINVKRQHDVYDQLLDIGFYPIMPLLNHYHDLIHPRHSEDRMRIDFESVKMSHIVLRLPGESPGADREVELAKKLGILVVYSIEELLEKMSIQHIIDKMTDKEK